MKYKKLFERGKIGSLELKNRIVMSPMATNYSDVSGEVSDREVRYFEERAKGGVGMIIVGITRIDDETGWTETHQMGATRHEHVTGMARLARAVHNYGTGIIVQLQHPGWRVSSKIIGCQPVSASVGRDPRGGDIARALTRAEVYEMIEKFIHGAEICYEAGMDGVELHAAHGYLIQQFLSPCMNKRTDEFGGSYENRFRFLGEIVKGIRTRLPRSFVLSVRISVEEYMEGGLDIPTSIRIAKDLEAMGVDAINASNGGGPSSPSRIIEVYSYDQGWKKELGKAIKANVNIPVIAVNALKTPDVAEQMLEEDVCDFIGLGRCNIADPEWSRKAYEGREDEIRSCIGCMYCFKCAGLGRALTCAINPKTGHEHEFENLKATGKGEKIAVIGGGPAGMEAAMTLKARGYEPILFEKTDKLGGALNSAAVPPHKSMIARLSKTMQRQLEIAGVEVRLNTEATVETIKELDPAGVFITCGGKPICPPVKGIESKNVIFAEDLLLEKSKIEGKKVHVIGSGLVGLETSMWLLSNGYEVDVVEMLPKIGSTVFGTILLDMYEKFEGKPIELHASRKLVEVKGNTAVYEDMASGTTVEEHFDTMVLAAGNKAAGDFAAPFYEAFENVRVLGDAHRNGSVAEAIEEGFGAAFVFEPIFAK